MLLYAPRGGFPHDGRSRPSPHPEPGGPEATSGLDGLCFHNLRGTAETHYILVGLPLGDVATILGWELKRGAEIARRQVTGEAIGMGMIARLRGGGADGQL